jgi:peroxiredoxin
MKRTISLLILIVSAITSVHSADSAYTVQGTFSKMKTGKIFLSVYRSNGVINDSAKIVNGKFSFKGHVQQPAQAVLYYKGKEGSRDNMLYFYAEPANIMITGAGDSLQNVKISGSKINADDKVLKGMMKEVSAWEDRNSALFDEAYKSKNKHVMDSLDAVDMNVMMAKRMVVGQFVKKYPASLRSAMALEENFGYYAEASDLEPLYNMLDAKIKATTNGKNVKKMLDTYKTVAMGVKAPEITQNDTSGHALPLSSIKGKVVMIDFWASWCGPCRRENPNIVKAYEQFHPKGFEIYGVSYDKTDSKWKKAINDDKLTWYEVSDLKGWQNSTSDQYYIKAIPANILIDQDGKIIAKNLFGQKLIDKLNQLLP